MTSLPAVFGGRGVKLKGPVVQKTINANLGLNLSNLGLNFNPKLLCVVQSLVILNPRLKQGLN